MDTWEHISNKGRGRKVKQVSKKKQKRNYRKRYHPKVIILPVCRKLDDRMSPGRLVAIAEWRDAK